MNKISNNLIRKFISGQRLSEDEFILLDKIINDSSKQDELYCWLEEHWEESLPEAVSLRFEQIREKIRKPTLRSRMSQLFIGLSKVAAVLFIPLLAAGLYFYFNRTISNELFTISTQKGEQTSIILPDGSKVWLNVDTKLSYKVDFGAKSRKLELEGEAYFEVKKNEKKALSISSFLWSVHTRGKVPVTSPCNKSIAGTIKSLVSHFFK